MNLKTIIIITDEDVRKEFCESITEGARTRSDAAYEFSLRDVQRTTNNVKLPSQM